MGLSGRVLTPGRTLVQESSIGIRGIPEEWCDRFSRDDHPAEGSGAGRTLPADNIDRRGSGSFEVVRAKDLGFRWDECCGRSDRRLIESIPGASPLPVSPPLLDSAPARAPSFSEGVCDER